MHTRIRACVLGVKAYEHDMYRYGPVVCAFYCCFHGVRSNSTFAVKKYGIVPS